MYLADPIAIVNKDSTWTVPACDKRWWSVPSYPRKTWWRHCMETLLTWLLLYEGKLSVDSCHKSAAMRSFDNYFFSLNKLMIEAPWHICDVLIGSENRSDMFVSNDGWATLTRVIIIWCQQEDGITAITWYSYIYRIHCVSWARPDHFCLKTYGKF